MSDSPDILAMKHRFAVELLKLRDPFRAAMAVESSVAVAIGYCQAWPSDPVVREHIDKLINAKVNVLPTRDDLSRELWDIGTNTLTRTDVKDRLAALKLYAEVNEFMPKSNAGSVSVNTQAGPRVLVVPQFGSPEEWRTLAMAQQSKLIAEARAGATQH